MADNIATPQEASTRGKPTYTNTNLRGYHEPRRSAYVRIGLHPCILSGR
jgi:hypothetical protein